MNSATKKTYISPQVMAAYKQEKDKAQNKLQSIKEEEEKKENAASSEEEELDDFQYQMRNRSCCEVDSDELDGGLNLSECEDMAEVFRIENKHKKRLERGGKESRKLKQEIDTNVFKIDFATLADKAEIATGDATFCKSCNSAFNFFSKIDDHQIWTCEFCLTKNEVDLEDEERPKSNAVNYIIEAAAQVIDKK